MRVQKHIFVTECGILNELLKLTTKAHSFRKLLFAANSVKMITCAAQRDFNLQSLKVVSRVQELFVGDRLPWITLTR